MAWDDWVFGIATGGAYNVGKTVYKAAKAADKAGDAVEEIADGAGTALAARGSTVTKLGKDMSSFLKEMEELLTIKRVAPRDEDDLWDEEVERLNALRQREAELLAELQAQGASDDDRSWFDSLFGAFFGLVKQAELTTRTKLAIVRGAIHEILYEEPGVVPTSIHNLQLILERFNTLEQPRLEEILDSLNDNLEESEEILQEVKKLFVIKTWRAVPVSELPEKKRKDLEVLEASFANFDTLIAKNTAISTHLQQALVQAQPAKFEMAKMVGVGVGGGGGGNPGGKPGDNLPTPSASLTGGGTPGNASRMIRAVLPSGPSFALKGKVSAMAAQPMAASVATALNHNVVAAYLDNYHTVAGRVRYYTRERLKVEKAIYRIKWVPVEEPGVIPKMLEEMRRSIGRIRTLLESVQSAFDFLAKYSLYIKIGLAVGGGLILLILLMSLIALIRVAVGL